jgi:hypothetical protein
MGEPDFVHDFEQAQRLHSALWAAGDYTRLAEQLADGWQAGYSFGPVPRRSRTTATASRWLSREPAENA